MHPSIRPSFSRPPTHPSIQDGVQPQGWEDPGTIYEADMDGLFDTTTSHSLTHSLTHYYISLCLSPSLLCVCAYVRVSE